MSARPPAFSTENRPDSYTFRINKPQRDDGTAGEPVASVTLPKPQFTALPYTFIGSQARECLYGSKASGLFTLDHKLGLSTKTAAGTLLSGTATRKGDAMVSTLMASHTFPQTGLTLTNIIGSSGAVDVELMRTVAPGARATLSGSLAPGPITKQGALAGKVGFEFGNEYVHLKVGHTVHAQPVINLSLASGTGQVQVGADIEFATSRAWAAAREAAALAATKQQGEAQRVAPSRLAAFDAAALVGGLTRWTAAMGWSNQGHHLALHVSDNGSAPLTLTTKLSYAASVRDGITVGAEASRPMPLQGVKGQPQPVQFAIGLSARLSSLAQAAQDVADELKTDDQQSRDRTASKDGGKAGADTALVKFKLESNGMVSFMYSDKLMVLGLDGPGSPSVQMTLAAQLDARAPFARAPRVGVTLEVV